MCSNLKKYNSEIISYLMINYDVCIMNSSVNIGPISFAFCRQARESTESHMCTMCI